MVGSPQASCPHLLPLPCPLPFGYPDPSWAPSLVPHCHWRCPRQPLGDLSASSSAVPSLRPPPPAVVLRFPPLPSLPATGAQFSSEQPAPPQPNPAPSPLRSGAGGGGRARRGPRLVDALPGGRARRVPERRGARAAREQRPVGARAGRCLRLPAPAPRSPLPAAGGRARGRGGGSGGPRARAQRRSREPRAALARRVDAAPPETAAPRAAWALRGGLSPRARLGRGGAGRCSHIKAHV